MAFTLDAMSIYGQDTRMLESVYPTPPSPQTWSSSMFEPESDPSIPTSKCHLLSLPLELRQHIYLYLLPSTISVLDRDNDSIVWHRGATTFLATCRQVHEEAAFLLYSTNVFVLSVVWDCTVFEYQWVLPSSLRPRRRIAFPEAFPARYIPYMRRFHVHVHHIDSYMGKTLNSL